MKKMVNLAVVLGVLATAAMGCNEDKGFSPREICDQATEAICIRLYECLSAEEIAAAGLPPDQSDCVVERRRDEGCARQTEENYCEPGETFQRDEAADCFAEIVGRTCEVVESAGPEYVCDGACG